MKGALTVELIDTGRCFKQLTQFYHLLSKKFFLSQSISFE